MKRNPVRIGLIGLAAFAVTLPAAATYAFQKGGKEEPEAVQKEKEKLVCLRNGEVGSSLTFRTCMTREAWREHRKHQSQFAKDYMQNSERDSRGCGSSIGRC